MTVKPSRRIIHLERTLHADRTGATLTYLMTYSEPFAFNVLTEDVDEMIQMLGALRLNLAPEVSMECPAGGYVMAVDPEVFIDAAPDGDPILHIRNVRFGWQHFRLPKPLARQVAEALIAHAEV